jgi:hypothetical protein
MIGSMMSVPSTRGTTSSHGRTGARRHNDSCNHRRDFERDAFADQTADVALLPQLHQLNCDIQAGDRTRKPNCNERHKQRADADFGHLPHGVSVGDSAARDETQGFPEQARQTAEKGKE